MYAPEDQDRLERLLRTNKLPEGLEAHYDRMAEFHHAETSGPIGHELCVSMLFTLELCPKLHEGAKANFQDVDWNELEDTGTVKVESKDNDQMEWRPGVFRGVADFGMIYVLYNGEDLPRDVMSKYCRLVEVKKPRPKRKTEQPGAPALA